MSFKGGKIFATCVLLISIAGFAIANEIDLDQIKAQLPEGALPPGFGNASDIENLKKVLQEKCIQSGNEEGYQEIENGARELVDCIQDILNFTTIQSEIEVATPIGELDSVFHKYCLKRPDVLKCVENFNDKVKKCLDDDEKESNDTFMRIIRGLLNFVCYKGGDQIALFIAEKGVECLKEKQNAIGSCVNETGFPLLSIAMANPDKVPKLVIGDKECTEMHKLKNCIVDELQGCQEITPANIIESMFRFIRNETSCADLDKSHQTTVSPLFSLLIMGILSLILSRIFK